MWNSAPWTWFLMGCLLACIWLAYQARFRREVGRWNRLSDEDVREIEELGRYELDDEELDLDEIERAEDEFWEESWEDPESW